jgi:phosphoadenosine phosphosulfate reductase
VTPELETRRAALSAALADIVRTHAPVAFATSLSVEDMVVADAIFSAALDVDVFTLDTGRLHGDTLALLHGIETRYGRPVRVVRPDARAVAAFVDAHGRDAFYEGVELRKRCCEIRKVEPLRRALAGKRAWITGLRREQSVTRAALAFQEHDAVHGIAKFNPLADWTEADVWAYVRALGVPYNRLHDQGYRSIGCAPCTRPVAPWEDVRAGRWWWERAESRECGLHVAPDGRLVRAKAPA